MKTINHKPVVQKSSLHYGRDRCSHPFLILVSILTILLVFVFGAICFAQAEPPATKTGSASDVASMLSPAEQHWLAQHNGSIRIGITEIPPQILPSAGGYKGLSIDYIHLLEEKLGCRFRLVPYATWNEVVQAAKQRRIDMIFAAQQTPERRRYLLFSKPYIELPNKIFVRQDRQGGTSLERMAGWSVAASEGSAVHEYLKREYPALKLHPVPNELVGLREVSLGEVDAMVCEISRASYYIQQQGILNLRIAGDAGLVYRLSFAVRNDWPTLAHILDKGLSAISAAERQDIRRHWIMVGEKTAFPGKTFWTGLAIILLVLGIVFAWNLTLRRVVRQRTLQLQQELAERRRIEEELRQSEEKYATIVNTATEGIMVLDSDHLVTFANTRMGEMLGRIGSEMLGRPLTDFMFEEDAADHQLRMKNRRQGLSEHYERRFRCPDGKTVWTLASATPLFKENHRFGGSFAMFADITDRKRMDEALNASEAELRALFDAMTDVIFVVNSEGRYLKIIDKNPSVLYRPADELLGKTLHEVFPQDQADSFLNLVLQVLDTQQSFNTEYRLSVENKEVWFNATLSPMATDKILMVSRDISEQKLAEKALRQLNEELEQRVKNRTAAFQNKSEELQNSQAALMNIVEDLNEKTAELEEANEKLLDLDRLKSLFIASMSHELRTPLNSIIGFSSILLNEWTGSLNDEQKENITSVLRSGKHLLSLINDVIDVSKIEAGNIESLSEETDLQDVVGEAVSAVDFDIKNKKLELQSQVEPCFLTTDRRRLLQCLLNLLSNAVKFTEQGVINVCAGPSKDGRNVEIAVSDTGIGIRDEDLDKLFSPFVRLDSPLRAKIPGTGLGLYLTRKLTTEVLQGQVSVASVFGEGSRFVLRVPTSRQMEGNHE